MDKSQTNADWYWSKRGSSERNGPVEWGRLEKLAREGSLKGEDFAWKEGMDDWKRASCIKELEHLVANPPPLPDETNEVEDTISSTPPPRDEPTSGENEENESSEQSSSEQRRSSSSSVLKRVVIPSVVGMIFLFGMSFMYNPTTSTSSLVSGGNTVTYDEFEQVENGMYYSQVEDIVGEGGTKVSSSEVEGFGSYSGVSTNMYKWQNGDGSNMVVVFQNDEVMSKSQFGLR